MVYESDFYTTRRPYRSTPSYSTYTISSPLSRQIRVLPGLGKVHVVHTYDRIVPYVGHKRLTVVTLPPKVYSTRPSILQKEYDWIENKVRPWVAYSPTNRYLNSDSSVRYVYSTNPISGLKYHTEYKPSEYYNFYRIIRPYSGLDDIWPYYTPYYYWPSYRSRLYRYYYPESKSYKIKALDDTSVGLYSPYWYRNWYNWYNSYLYRISLPLRKTLCCYWPNYCYDCYYNFYYPASKYFYNYWYRYYRSSWRPYLPLDRWYPKRSYYWLKYRPMYYNFLDYVSPNYYKYLQSIFDDETRLIRAQTASLLKQIHLPVPRIRAWSIAPLNRSGDFKSLPSKYSNDTYIHRLLTVSPNSKITYATYYTEPVKKYIGQGHLSCVTYAGDKNIKRRRPLAIYEDALRNDIQLLSYYINKFRQEKIQPKEIEVPLSPIRPSRIFTVQKPIDDPVQQEIKDLREARAARLAKIYETDTTDVENALKAKKQKEEARLQEERERALAEEKAKKEAQAKKEAAKKEEAARQAELARQEQLAAQAAAERAAELERQAAEKARQEELAREAEAERLRKEEEERRLAEEAKAEEERRLAEEARKAEEERRLAEEAKAEEERLAEEARKAEEERQQLLRLEEIARQAEEEREAELARQAEELVQLAKQKEEEEKLQQEAELAELARQEAELAQQEAELADSEQQQVAEEVTEEPVSEVKEEAEVEAEAPAEVQESAEVNEEPEPEPEPVVTEPVSEDNVAFESEAAPEAQTTELEEAADAEE